MNTNWIARETTTHQDHVIAHVVGTTMLGYFIFDEALHILLDIGFIWTIFLDGEMGLVPHPVAISELEMDNAPRTDIRDDIEALLSDNVSNPKRLICLNAAGRINDVGFFAFEERRRLLLSCEEGNIEVKTSMESAEIHVNEC